MNGHHTASRMLLVHKFKLQCFCCIDTRYMMQRFVPCRYMSSAQMGTYQFTFTVTSTHTTRSCATSTVATSTSIRDETDVFPNGRIQIVGDRSQCNLQIFNEHTRKCSTVFANVLEFVHHAGKIKLQARWYLHSKL